MPPADATAAGDRPLPAVRPDQRRRLSAAVTRPGAQDQQGRGDDAPDGDEDPVHVEQRRPAGPDITAGQGAADIAHGLATWWSPEAVARSLDTTTVLVASGASGPVATGNIDLRGEIPISWKLYVRPAAQRTGAGSALLKALIGYAPGAPVRLSHIDGNTPAARFYAAHGFTEIRREPGAQPGWPAEVRLERPPTPLPSPAR